MQTPIALPSEEKRHKDRKECYGYQEPTLFQWGPKEYPSRITSSHNPRCVMFELIDKPGGHS